MMVTRGIGTVPDEGHGADETVEFDTFMRDRPVRCRWSRGELTGDRELLERIEHMGFGPAWRASPASVARAISAAVAHPVTIRVLSPSCDEVDLRESTTGGAALGGQVSGRHDLGARSDVLGDYWLG